MNSTIMMMVGLFTMVLMVWGFSMFGNKKNMELLENTTIVKKLFGFSESNWFRGFMAMTLFPLFVIFLSVSKIKKKLQKCVGRDLNKIDEDKTQKFLDDYDNSQGEKKNPYDIDKLEKKFGD